MTFYAYMLECADKSYYTGHTDNLEVRLNQHVTSGTRSYTSFRLPIKLVWAEQFPTRLEALEAERQIKGWSRAKKEALIRGDWRELSRLARSRPSTSSGRTVREVARRPNVVAPEFLTESGKSGNRKRSDSVRPELVEGRETPEPLPSFAHACNSIEAG